jgi:Amt family ammonium transporter
MSIERILAGIDGGEFKLYLQAKISCATQSIVGYEALVRWDHPVHGIISPAHFVPQIEAAGMEHRLARYMIDLSMAHLAAHADATFHVAINVSLETFRSPLFRTMLAELRAVHDVPAERVILELTERGVGEISGADIEAMTRIRMDGFLLSLDDFGVGQSSIQRLVQLPLSEVKIDQMFIRDVTTSEEARRLVESIIAMGQALKIPITAEGIENAETFEMLKGFGCTNAQGFLFGRPFPVQIVNDACPVP